MNPSPAFLRTLPYVPRLNEDDIQACADAWEATETDLGTTLEVNEQLLTLNKIHLQRLEAARWLIETAPHCYGSMTREWETRRSSWLAALAAVDSVALAGEIDKALCGILEQDHGDVSGTEIAWLRRAVASIAAGGNK